MPTDSRPLIVAGIDVGGRGKGFHGVSLRNGMYHQKYHSKDVAEIVNWCRYGVKAMVVAIDAPCRWSTDGRARPAERQLMQKGIQCFASPTKRVALNHPSDNYGWMLNGEALFSDLERTHSLCTSIPLSVGQQQCFETFPHAVSCALSKGLVSAKNKRTLRRALLEQAGIDTANLTNIDLVDAALCALTAHYLASGRPCNGYGEPSTGLIIVPKL